MSLSKDLAAGGHVRGVVRESSLPDVIDRGKGGSKDGPPGSRAGKKRLKKGDRSFWYSVKPLEIALNNNNYRDGWLLSRRKYHTEGTGRRKQRS